MADVVSPVEGASARSTIVKSTQSSTVSGNSKNPEDANSAKVNIFIRLIRAVFGYRKTSLTFFLFLTVVATLLLSVYDNTLEFSVNNPPSGLESKVVEAGWSSLQEIGRYQHPYTSSGNDYVHDYLEKQIKHFVRKKTYSEYDNDLNYTNNAIFMKAYLSHDALTYYESNNLLVRINGTNSSLPALLLSAHFDSVPGSFGVTDDGFGIASLLAVLDYYTSEETSQPQRTIIFNFNNNEESGLYGAQAFLSHPWFKQVKYFLNLEGTGAGGKAVLFRGTDYGIVKFFNGVRFPYATSLFQQGFNNRLILSETDYLIYKEDGGLRGLDLAFFRPRDLYHTPGDSIRNVNIKSLWHMFSNALDFTKIITSGPIDLDEESDESQRDFALYTSFLNYFYSVPVSQFVILNIVLLLLIPAISFPLCFIIFYYKRNWDFNFVNFIKLPVSLAISIFVLKISTTLIRSVNEYLPNSCYLLILFSLVSLFLFTNYLVLNVFNFLFKSYKGVNHDEKLISILQISFVYWIASIWSTFKLSRNQLGDDHTGEFPITILLVLQSVASILGLLGWTFQRGRHHHHEVTPETRPLLENSDSQRYNSNQFDEDHDIDHHPGLSLASSSLSIGSHVSTKPSNNIAKYFSYDWSLQFLIIVPLSSLIVYNSGFLILSGLNKAVQEYAAGANYFYLFVEGTVIFWSLPLLPFIFKFNRIVVIFLMLIIIQGAVFIPFSPPFDPQNPLKLRFLQKIDLNSKPATSTITVVGVDSTWVSDVLSDIPSVKNGNGLTKSEPNANGAVVYSYDTSLLPTLISGAKSFDDYLNIEVIKDSSSNIDNPFGLLTGEIKINAPKTRNCQVNFNLSDTFVELFAKNSHDSPVKTVIIYNDKATNNGTSSVIVQGIPEGFSKDKNGNYIYKDLNGIDQLHLDKLDWDSAYHLGFQWVPNLVDITSSDSTKVKLNKLGVSIRCFWGELGSLVDKKEVKEMVPAYEEIFHYSPNYVNYANGDRGLVTVEKYFEI